METFSEKGFKATGTFRADRTNACPLKFVKELKKTDRWEYQYFTSGDQIELIRWNDNIVVTIGSNAVSVEPVGNVKWSKRGKGRINVLQPHATKACNKCMGGVDLVDRALSDLRPNFNGKKWYCSLIINALNLGFLYCWRLHQLSTKPKGDQKSFRRDVKLRWWKLTIKFPDQVEVSPFQMKYDLTAKNITKNQDHWEHVSCARRAIAMCVKNVIGACTTQNYAFSFFMRSKSSI